VKFKGDLTMNIHQHRWPKFLALKHRFCMTAIAMLPLLTPVQAQTSDPKPSASATAPATTTPSGKNVYIGGGNVRPLAPVRGDLFAAGGRVTVDQPVQGDATLAGGSVLVTAPIGDDLRVTGGDIHVDNSVGGELYASGGNVTIGGTAEVADAVTVYAGQATLDGKVKGPLKIYAQKMVLNGQVGGDVELNAEEIEIGPQARLSAALTYPADARFKTAEGAVIGGVITRGQAMNGRPDTHRNRDWHGQMMGSGSSSGWAGSVGSAAVSFVLLLAVAALVLLGFTGFSKRAAHSMLTTPWPALAAGVAVFMGTPMVAVLLCITLIGIPLGIALIMVFPLLLLIGWIIGVYGLAQRLQRAVQKNAPGESVGAMMGFYALTLLLVMLISSVPFVGFLVVAAIWLMGTGACALELYRQFQSRNKPGQTPPGSTPSGSSRQSDPSPGTTAVAPSAQ
jgi:cytoskeletal protein CcmA (bactofilin family)